MLRRAEGPQEGLTVVGRVLLSRNHRLRVEQGPVRTRLDIVDGARLKIDVERTGNVLARASLGEERGEAAVVVGLGALSGTAVGLQYVRTSTCRPRHKVDLGENHVRSARARACIAPLLPIRD